MGFNQCKSFCYRRTVGKRNLSFVPSNLIYRYLRLGYRFYRRHTCPSVQSVFSCLLAMSSIKINLFFPNPSNTFLDNTLIMLLASSSQRQSVCVRCADSTHRIILTEFEIHRIAMKIVKDPATNTSSESVFCCQKY